MLNEFNKTVIYLNVKNKTREIWIVIVLSIEFPSNAITANPYTHQLAVDDRAVPPIAEHTTGFLSDCLFTFGGTDLNSVSNNMMRLWEAGEMLL